VNLLLNGSFEAVDDGAPGWINDAGRIEIFHWGFAADGLNNIELDADVDGFLDFGEYVGTPDYVHQAVTTQAGQTYTFSFEAALRPGTYAATNTFQVLWNGNVIDTVTPETSASDAWGHYSYSVVADGAVGTVGYRELPGSDDGLGGMIDNVVLATQTGSSRGVTGTSANEMFVAGAGNQSFTGNGGDDTFVISPVSRR
jgi:hypothetical protein